MPAVVGAVYKPELDTLPPVADHVTAVFELPVTVAENCCDASTWIDAAVGLITIEITGGATVTVALADLLVSATLVAFTVYVPPAVGAVYKPKLSILPPLAVHVTAVLVLPVTVAVNC